LGGVQQSKIKQNCKKILTSADEIYVSSASIWEMSIKSSLGKLNVDVPKLASEIISIGFYELPVRVHHSLMVRTLPAIHKDPFDRMLIAQAISEPLNLLTSDKRLAGYSELVITV
jgi:PIN domain nuclease of toxin-antitoxin system